MRRLFLVAAVCAPLAASVSAATFQSVGIYQSFDQLTAWAHQFADGNPDLVELVQYGASYQGRPLLALNISLQPGVNDPTKPEFLFTGGIHAREVIASQAAYQLAERLVEGYRSGAQEFTDILAEREVWIVPNMNPDGRIVVEGGGSSQRTNLQGVDLNRNFPHSWEKNNASPGSETYAGPEVLSAPEASQFWTMLHDSEKFDHLLGAIDFHSGAQTIIDPWLSPTEFRNDPLPTAERGKFDALADQMSQESGIGVGRLHYDSYGTLTDSLYDEFGAYAFTEELYQGVFTDYFTYFNPVDAATRDDRVNRAVDSALFLLSDEAFALVPEPSTVLLLVTAGVFVLLRRGRRSAAGD
ncbi:MAG: PEP-CTERM sorting domain-containing protein [Pirellulales bacterium]|nr:PEP-CTERM sorting domain-containing protein [Pirellulales bacterium]